jgi:hypothetical protein
MDEAVTCKSWVAAVSANPAPMPVDANFSASTGHLRPDLSP